jgi:putative solute:sodium symporter small subunit
MPEADLDRCRWRARQRITAVLLGGWFAVTFGVAFFARELSGAVRGWSFSFWIAAQGAPLAYLAIVVVYARLMRRVDERRRPED